MKSIIPALLAFAILPDEGKRQVTAGSSGDHVELFDCGDWLDWQERV